MSAKVTFLAALVLAGICPAAAASAQSTVIVTIHRGINGHPECSRAIEEFVAVIDSDVETGNLNRSAYTRIVADLRTIKSACVTGNEKDVLRRLSVVKHRYGYH